MRFRVAAQHDTGEWENVTQLGDLKLSECRRLAAELWATGRYVFVCVYTSRGHRRAWYGRRSDDD